MEKLELLAPARDMEAARAAVDYGADALYVGGPAFGARAAAGNSAEDIARIVQYARRFGVRVYAALNTLIYEPELPQAERVARELIAAGVDALIIQDTAFLRMGLTGVEFHASTQMCNTSPEHVRFLAESGFSRVILERGLSLKEIREIRQNTDVELECFVHGAICVGFSGQCYLSRSMGPRSGNRGDCMQACRLSYDLLDADGKAIMRNKHLLSVLDLDLSDRLGELVDAGVTSFKIEGRLKDTGYVKNVVAHYRRQLDRIGNRTSSGHTVLDFTPDPRRSFSRGDTHWMLDGNRRGLACFDTPKATGIYIGEVASVGDDYFEIASSAELVAGDGICFLAGGELTGTNINHAEGRRVYPNRMDGLKVGTAIFRNHDKAFESILEQSRAKRVIDVKAKLEIESDRISLLLVDEDGVSAEVSVALTGEAAKDPAKMEATFRTQLSKTGDTIFNIAEVEICGGARMPFMETRGGARMPFMPISLINALRRDAVALLLQNRISRRKKPTPANEDKNFPYPFATTGDGSGAENGMAGGGSGDGLDAENGMAGGGSGDGSDAENGMACGELNVTNTLARQFYADHGVRDFETPHDLRETLNGECVMTSAYCIRREIGQCLKEKPLYAGDLYLRRGTLTYRLEFDCVRCRMKLNYLPSAFGRRDETG